jgi:hypothetical protein
MVLKIWKTGTFFKFGFSAIGLTDTQFDSHIIGGHLHFVRSAVTASISHSQKIS